MLGGGQSAADCLMLSRLINGLVTGLIAWSVTQSKWIALVVFGVTAGLSSNKFKWIEEITKTIKAEVDKAKNASTGATNSTTTTTTANQQSTPTMQSAAAKMAAKPATNFPPKQAVPEMLESKNDAAGHNRTDKTSMKLTIPDVIATVVEQPRKEIPMFIKLIIAVIIGGAAGFMTENPGVAIGVFVGAFFVALLIEGMKIVPQQSAWVVERLGKFHTV